MSEVKQPSFSDVATSFNKNVISKDVLRITDSEAVKRSIKNLVFTRKYERLLDPKIGVDIQSFLFEPIDALTSISIRQAIETNIQNYEPRAFLQRVEVEPDYDNQRYFVRIVFSLLNSSTQSAVELFLDRIR